MDSKAIQKLLISTRTSSVPAVLLPLLQQTQVPQQNFKALIPEPLPVKVEISEGKSFCFLCDSILPISALVGELLDVEIVYKYFLDNQELLQNSYFCETCHPSFVKLKELHESLKSTEEIIDKVMSGIKAVLGMKQDRNRNNYESANNDEDETLIKQEEVDDYFVDIGPMTTNSESYATIAVMKTEPKSPNHVVLENDLQLHEEEHNYTNQEPQSTSKNLSQSGKSNIQSKHSCPLCPNLFLTTAALEQHFTFFHPGKKTCKVCGKKEKYSFKLAKHIKSRHPEEFMLVSRKMYDSLPEINEQLADTKANNLDCFHCQKCKRKFSTGHSLEKHFKDKHAGKKFQCRFCPRQFSVFWNFSHHERQQHWKENPLTCEACGKQFLKVPEWKRHMKSH